MRILMLHNSAGGVSEYRHFIPARAMERVDIDVTYFPAAVPKMEDWLVKYGKDYDVLHVGYALELEHAKFYATAREFTQAHLVVDIDDDITNVPTYNHAYMDYHPSGMPRKAAILSLRIADGVATTTPELSATMRPYAKRTGVLHNYHDPIPWRDLPTDPHRDDDKAVRLMFAGSAGHYGDLAEVKEAVTAIMEKYNVRLFFMGFIPDWAMQWCSDNKDARNNRAFFIQGASMSNFRAVIKWLAPDVYLAPLQLNPFNNCKSHIKAYDAAEVGAAMICTDVGAYSHLDPSTILKVSNTFEQWRSGLEYLVTDVAARRRLAHALRTHILADWTIDTHIKEWVEFYSAVCQGPRVQSIEDVVRPV